jgi:glycosyltransferase domain-containing protein
VTPEEIELLSDLTIIIPTCERPLALERAIEYWQDLPVKVLILDGSEKPWFSVGDLERLPSIGYFHVPHIGNENWMENFARRMQVASSLPSTKFSALCGDDDFFSDSGLILAIRRLQIDDGVDAVVGVCGEFRRNGEELMWHLRYTEWKNGINSRSNNLEERVLDRTGSFYLYYSVMKSEIWRSVFSLVYQTSYDHDYAHEHLHRAIALGHCRVSVERYIVWIKEAWNLNPNVIGQASRTREADWYRNRKNRAEVKMITDHLAMGITTTGGISVHVARRIAKKYMRRTAKITDTAKFRKVKKLIISKIVYLVSILPMRGKSTINSLLPKKLRVFTGAVSQVPFDNLTKNNYFALETLLDLLPSTGIGFDRKDFERIERVLLMPREELRLRANI